MNSLRCALGHACDGAKQLLIDGDLFRDFEVDSSEDDLVAARVIYVVFETCRACTAVFTDVADGGG